MKIISLRPVLRLTSAVGASVVLLTACSSGGDVPDTSPAPTPATSLGAATPVQETCADRLPRTASFPALPVSARNQGLQAQIRARGRLVVGVSSDSYLLGALRAGSSTQFEGFDIDVAREVARDLLGDPNRITFKVITAADREQAVNTGVAKNGVDLVARNMTMNCARWKTINFSGVYFQAAQQTMVRKGEPARSLVALGKAGAVVCAPKASTSLTALPRLAPGAKPYGADQHTACLALLQEGRVDAITGDNTVLAGLVKQEPATEVLPEKVSSEPYGLGVAKAHPEFARYVNGVLQRMIGDGTWQRLYDRWFKGPLNASAAPARLVLTRPLP
jgi:polar amino acid transport system substrate-binding protein